MINRYSRPEMSAIWTDKNKFDTYLKIELLNAEALCEKGIVSVEELRLLQEKAAFSLPRIAELEAETLHDVVAFTRAVSESLGPEKRFIHYGLTSTDVVDTANGFLLKQANRIILKDLRGFMTVLKTKAQLYKETYCIGRTHGMHADVTVFGLKWTLWYAEMERNLSRFIAAAKDVECGKISGAVGNYAFTDPDIETFICQKLDIDRAKISTQVLQRDRHAAYLAVLALIGTTLEKIATEIRSLQRSEIAEVSEAFSPSQKGSSAMPHKHNPIASENICGIARVLRGYMVSAYEDVALWHERDISHSSVERIILPDATLLVDYILSRYSGVLDQLAVYPEQMKKNIELTRGLVFSQRVLTELVHKGLSREEAYDLVQALAKETMESHTDFQSMVRQNETIKNHFDLLEIDRFFALDFYGRNVDQIYQRVFTPQGSAK